MDNIIYRKYKQDMGSNFEDWAYTYFSAESDKLDCFLLRREVFENSRKTANIPNMTMQKFTSKLKAFCLLATHISQLNPPELCNSQNRIIKRVENSSEEMIYIQSAKYKSDSGIDFLPKEI